ncbi:MAG: hypothetical protein AAGA46_03155 [Cyanobacteria bacterium P01_F01_bin.13]
MPENTVAKENGLFSDAFGNLLRSGSIGLSQVPKALKKAIREKVWTNLYIYQTSSYVQHHDIREWIEAHPPEGLGSKVKTVEALIKDDTELSVEFKEAIAGRLKLVGAPTGNKNATKKENNVGGTNIECSSAQGNTSGYLLARMKRDLTEADYQEAEARVKSGVAINAVAREYGIKKSLVRVSWAEDADPQAVAGKLFEKCEPDFLMQVLAILNEALA